MRNKKKERIKTAIKNIGDYGSKTKDNLNNNIDQFIYKANKSDNTVFRIMKKIGEKEYNIIHSLKHSDETYHSLLGFLENKPIIKNNMKKIIVVILGLILGCGAYAINRGITMVAGNFAHYSVQEYLNSYEGIRTGDENVDTKLMTLLTSAGDVYLVDDDKNSYKAISKYSDDDGDHMILLVTIDKESKGYKDNLSTDKRKIGILMNKDTKGNINFKMTETYPTLPILFNYKQQTVSISPSDYKTDLKISGGDDDNKPLIKAAIYAAYKLNLIDLDETHFNKI